MTITAATDYLATGKIDGKKAVWNAVKTAPFAFALGYFGAPVYAYYKMPLGFKGQLCDDAKNLADDAKNLADDAATQADELIEGGTASKWVDDAGKTIRPPNNGAAAGTEKMINLGKGTTFGRIGGDTGYFVAPPKTAPDKLSLAHGTDISKYTEYVVTKPIPGVEKATVAPWFDKPGGGIQFKLPMSIKDLIREGYITPK